MARDDLKYHSIDMAAQHRVDLRLNVTRLVRLFEVDLSYSFFLVKKSWTFFFNEIISNDQVKLKCLKFEDITQDPIREAIQKKIAKKETLVHSHLPPSLPSLNGTSRMGTYKIGH